MAGGLSDLKWNFERVSEFIKVSGTKHEVKGYKYFVEKYIHDVNGKCIMSIFVVRAQVGVATTNTVAV